MQLWFLKLQHVVSHSILPQYPRQILNLTAKHYLTVMTATVPLYNIEYNKYYVNLDFTLKIKVCEAIQEIKKLKHNKIEASFHLVPSTILDINNFRSGFKFCLFSVGLQAQKI